MARFQFRLFAQEEPEEHDFSKLNHLSPELKQLIVKGQTLVNEVKEKMRDRNYSFDLTSKMQLKTDCKAVEKYIRMISEGKAKEKHIKLLENAIIRLRTTIDGVIRFYTR